MFKYQSQGFTNGIARSSGSQQQSNVEIKSTLTLNNITPQWAVENRQTLEETLKHTLGLGQGESVVITSIKGPSPSSGRQLQTAGVQLDFTIFAANQSTLQQHSQTLNKMVTGDVSTLNLFTTRLDVELLKVGKQPVRLDASNIKFEEQQATITQGNNMQQNSQSGSQLSYTNSNFGYNMNNNY